jgi:hypothetical protein
MYIKQHSSTHHRYLFLNTEHCKILKFNFTKEYIINIVAYLLKPRTVEVEKQQLLGNGPYTRNRGTRHVRCDVTQQYKICCNRRSLWIRAATVR